MTKNPGTENLGRPGGGRLGRLSLAAFLFFAFAASTFGATRHVANNGIDGAGCGTAASPCRTITQGIANATEGDTVMVGPGRYGDLNRNGSLGEPQEETPEPGCDCALAVNKGVVLISSDGAAATVIDSRSVAVANTVVDQRQRRGVRPAGPWLHRDELRGLQRLRDHGSPEPTSMSAATRSSPSTRLALSASWP